MERHKGRNFEEIMRMLQISTPLEETRAYQQLGGEPGGVAGPGMTPGGSPPRTLRENEGRGLEVQSPNELND